MRLMLGLLGTVIGGVLLAIGMTTGATVWILIGFVLLPGSFILGIQGPGEPREPMRQ